MDVIIRIYGQTNYKTGERIHVIFEITNQSNKTLFVSTHPTPLDGLNAECFIIRSNKRRLAYDGPAIPPHRPGPADFLEMRPGASRSIKVDLSRAYNLVATGVYTVRFNKKALTLTTQKPAAGKRSPVRVAGRPAALKIDSRDLTFRLLKGKKSRPTHGHFLRTTLPKVIAQHLKTTAVPVALQARTLTHDLSAPIAPNIINNDPTKPERPGIITTAHNNGYQLAVKALQELKVDPTNEDPQYFTWFGDAGSGRASTVISNFTNIVNDFVSQAFTYDLSGPGCGGGDLGNAQPGVFTINICENFWHLLPVGQGSQAGRIVHEHSHVSANTIDDRNGAGPCQDLAVNDPSSAIQNADNYEFYSGG